MSRIERPASDVRAGLERARFLLLDPDIVVIRTVDFPIRFVPEQLFIAIVRRAGLTTRGILRVAGSEGEERGGWADRRQHRQFAAAADMLLPRLLQTVGITARNSARNFQGRVWLRSQVIFRMILPIFEQMRIYVLPGVMLVTLENQTVPCRHSLTARHPKSEQVRSWTRATWRRTGQALVELAIPDIIVMSGACP